MSAKCINVSVSAERSVYHGAGNLSAGREPGRSRNDVIKEQPSPRGSEESPDAGSFASRLSSRLSCSACLEKRARGSALSDEGRPVRIPEVS